MARNLSRLAMYEWSRQSGKSMGCALAINDDILRTEAQGRRTLWTLISRSLLQAKELHRKVRSVGEAVMMARRTLKGIEEGTGTDDLDKTTFELTYPGGSRVIVVSGHPDAAAGYTGNVWWDEVGLTKKANDLFGAAYPVISRGTLRFIMTSTPRPGFWYRRCDIAGQPESGWTFDRLTIHDAIAQGCPMDADELRRGLADDLKWRQEYLCEHIDDDVCWLPWELIVNSTDDAATSEPAIGIPAPDWIQEPVYAGWDVARWQNLSVGWFASKRGNRMTTRCLLVMQRMTFEAQIAAMKATAARFPRFTRLCIDATGMGEMVAEVAQKQIGRVEAVKMTGGVKEVIAGDLRRVMEERNFLVPDDDAIRSDFHSVHRTMTAAGNPRFEGESEGSHADRFWAAALAVHAAIQPGGALTIEDAGMLDRIGERVGRSRIGARNEWTF